MKTKEKINLIKQVVAHYQELDSNFDAIYKLFGNADSKFCNSVWNAFDAYTDTVEKLIGDEFGNINWFIFENGCGKKGLECTFEGRNYKIKTVKELVQFMELTSNNE